jgi:hypothetical protein
VYVLCDCSGGDEDLSSWGIEKYRADGSLVGWFHYGLKGYYKVDDFATDFIVRPGGGVTVIGGSEAVDWGEGEGGVRTFVVSFRPDGTRRWTHVYAGAHGRPIPGLSSLAPCPSGGIYVTGSTDDGLILFRYKADGTKVSARGFGVRSRLGKSGTDVAVDPTGRIVVSGASRRSDQPFFVAVLRRDGSVRWRHTYSSAGRFGLDPTGRIYVTEGTQVIAMHALARDGSERWYSEWPSPPATGTGPMIGGLVAQSASVWICGASDPRPETGVDQLVLGWASGD